MSNLKKIKFESIEDTLGKNYKKKNIIFPDNYYTYDIHRHLKTDFHNLKVNKHDRINLCCFRIVKSRPNKIIDKPFLQYLLYKYPQNQKKINNLCVFPFTKYISGDYLKIAENLIITLFNEPYKTIGYIKDNKNIYMFYHIDFKSVLVTLLKKDISYIWGLIDEICNKKKIITFPVHKSVTRVFLKNPKLIYLKDKNKKCIEIPTAVFYGETQELLNYVATLGLKSSAMRHFGPYYYFTDFKASVRTAGWSSNYEKREIFNKSITDKDGKIKQGGIVRFALFLGNHRVIMDRKSDPTYNLVRSIDKKSELKKSHEKKLFKNKSKWAEIYESIVISNYKNINRSGYFWLNSGYITKKYNNFISLSLHLLDKKTLKPNYDPEYEFYDIL